MSSLKAIRYGAWAAVAALALGVGIVTYNQVTNSGTSALVEPVSAIGGPFTMVNGDGQTVTEADFKGKPSLFFFGFTFCPDVCPTTLSDMQGWIEQLGADADGLNYVFVTVDPERDTPDVMKNYTSAFDPRIVSLTGSREQVDQMIKAYRVYSKKVSLSDGGYTMDHSAAVFLMDKDNKFVGTVAYGENPDTAMTKIRNLLKRS